jgi:formylglycine-generating enzyme required for sulfatase activity
MTAAAQLLAFARRYGKPAGFVARLALSVFVPGAPLLAELADRLFDTGADLMQSGADDAILPLVEGTRSDIHRLGEVLGVLDAEMGDLLAQVASLEGQPERARELLIVARRTDAGVQAAIARLATLQAGVDRVAEQTDRILEGQAALRRMLEQGLGTAAARARAAAPPTPAMLPLIDSRDLARREQARWVQQLDCRASWTNDLGVRFRLIPPGRFRMGAADGDPHAAADERPGHTIAIAHAFYIATFPLTVGAIRHFLREASDADDAELGRLRRDQGFADGCRSAAVADDMPAGAINAHDALVLCRWLTRRDGRCYRLPTEAEWEYTARAGATGVYWWDEGIPAPSRAIFAAAAPLPADERRVNSWGLCDVVGNLAEWTASEYAALDASCATRAAGCSIATRTVRGGSWADALGQVRLSRRQSMNAASRKPWLGVRLVCDLERA